nr:MAG TPA: hypothetical protein [Caudoviricetes sp.]
MARHADASPAAGPHPRPTPRQCPRARDGWGCRPLR